MPRDVLLFLVLVAVLLNIALLVGVGIARWRHAGSPVRPRRPVVRDTSPARPPARAALSTRERPTAWPPAGVRSWPAMAIREVARPIAVPAIPLRSNALPAAPVPLAPAEPQPVAAAVTSPSAGARQAPSSEIAPTRRATFEAPSGNGAVAPSDEPSEPVDVPRPAATEPATRRGRRFVLPRNDEDKGRTERAIEAFLGEPAPSGSTSTHRPRRRARRHRTPGEGAAPLVLVAALGGFEQLRQTVGRDGATRFAEAYGQALRATLRSGDNVTDLGQGRLRLVVIADEEGARAMMDRARAVCEPWLKLAPVPLALRVRPMPDPRSGNGHQPDGRPDRRQGDDGQVGGPLTGADHVLPPPGRPDDGNGRRLAAG